MKTLFNYFLLCFCFSVVAKSCNKDAERLAERLPNDIIIHKGGEMRLKYAKIIWVDSTGTERIFLVDSTAKQHFKF